MQQMARSKSKNRSPNPPASKGFRGWLMSTETPRWWLILLTIVGPTISLGPTLFVDSQKRSADNRAQQAQLLIDSMMQFYIHASALTHEVEDKNVASPEIKKALSQNLSEQFVRLQMMDTLLPQSQKVLADDYRNSLLQMENTVKNVNGREDMRQFWVDSSKLLVARNRLRDVLRQFSLGA
jgi:hypothetical protein